MSKKRLILKTTFWSAVAASVYFPASLAVTLHLSQHEDPDIEVYIQENLEQIIEEQEEVLGITYPAERPTIKYVLPEEHLFRGIIGLYNDRTDTIYLASGLLTKPSWDFTDFIATIATFNSTEDGKRVVDHELAHFYCDKIKEQVFGDKHSISDFHYLLSKEERVSQRLINEGIARYVENRMNGEEDPFPFEEWPTEIKSFSNEVIYDGGCALVKPVIDQYGEKGIVFLLFNPPTPKELFTPQQYQERILKDIAKL